MPAGKLIMMSKRKREQELDEESKAKRRRKRSRSEPRRDTDNPEKREVLRRLFGRCASEENSRPTVVNDEVEDDVLAPDDDDDDSLLDDTVPVNLDPEQLGFLMCAQETLRFLQERGLTLQHPMLARLRLHFIDSFHHIALA